jgi:hypothetical protein
METTLNISLTIFTFCDIGNTMSHSDGLLSQWGTADIAIKYGADIDLRALKRWRLPW